MDLCAGPIFSKLQNGPIHNGRGRLGIYWDGSLTKRGSQDQVGGWWSPLIDKPLFLLWEVEKCGQCEKQVDEKCVGLRNGEKHCKAFDGCEDLLMGVKRADPSDCPNSCLASPTEGFIFQHPRYQQYQHCFDLRPVDFIFGNDEGSSCFYLSWSTLFKTLHIPTSGRPRLFDAGLLVFSGAKSGCNITCCTCDLILHIRVQDFQDES